MARSSALVKHKVKRVAPTHVSRTCALARSAAHTNVYAHARTDTAHTQTRRAALTDVLLLELAGQVALYECRLSDATVTHQHELERWLCRCLRAQATHLGD